MNIEEVVADRAEVQLERSSEWRADVKLSPITALQMAAVVRAARVVARDGCPAHVEGEVVPVALRAAIEALDRGYQVDTNGSESVANPDKQP